MVQVDENRDRFEDQLDGKLKRSILRGPRGEVNVGELLQRAANVQGAISGALSHRPRSQRGEISREGSTR